MKADRTATTGNHRMPTSSKNGQAEDEILPPPKILKDRFSWLGPGVTWMAAGAGGAGELLFPPRIGSLYGYTFVWALVSAGCQSGCG